MTIKIYHNDKHSKQCPKQKFGVARKIILCRNKKFDVAQKVTCCQQKQVDVARNVLTRLITFFLLVLLHTVSKIGMYGLLCSGFFR